MFLASQRDRSTGLGRVDQNSNLRLSALGVLLHISKDFRSRGPLLNHASRQGSASRRADRHVADPGHAAPRASPGDRSSVPRAVRYEPMTNSNTLRTAGARCKYNGRISLIFASRYIIAIKRSKLQMHDTKFIIFFRTSTIRISLRITSLWFQHLQEFYDSPSEIYKLNERSRAANRKGWKSPR